MAVVDVNISYQQSADPAKFGQYRLSLTDEVGQQQNVELKFIFDDLWRFARDTSSVTFDLLVFAMSVYNADRAVSRAKYSEEGWKRNIHLRVPVVNVATMERGLESFRSAVDFLTGDVWEFEFVQAAPYNYAPPLIQFENHQDYDRVSLFSGGLDSLIGFVDGCSQMPAGKKVLLISHAELGKEGKDQTRILGRCVSNRLFDGQYDRVFISAGLRLRRGNTLETEATFRARSILFFAAGIYCASAISPYMPVTIPENGTISLNIPLDKGRRSACSTRTTHPVFLRRLQSAMNAIGIQNPLVNPYQLKSKKDMVDDCCQYEERKRALVLLCSDSCSCAKRSHKRYWIRRNVLHCGVCLPCLYRRVSLSGIEELRNEQYGLDVFTPAEIQINRSDIKRNRDFKSLLYFLRNRCRREVIETELIANGITGKAEVEAYTDFVLHSYDQVKVWLRTNANEDIRQLAGI